MERADGLTPRGLHYFRRSWWDETFSRLLLDAVPLDSKLLLEVDCGLAPAAHTLLPSLPDARYLGVDFNPERLGEAKKEMAQARIAPRVDLRLGAPGKLPAEDASVDVWLSIMSMQHMEDVDAVLAEALRVLKVKGRVVAVEPDNLGQRFYFDGGLEEISRCFHELSKKARVARQPADIALGPRLPALMTQAGLQHVQMIAHMVNSTRRETATAFFDRLGRVAHRMAEEGGLSPDDEVVANCDAAVRRCLFSGLPKRVGFSCHLVPAFFCVGIKQ